MKSEKELFYKTQIIQNNSKILSYSNAFLLDLKFRNVGLSEPRFCLISIHQPRGSGLINQVKDFIKPLHKINLVLKGEAINMHVLKLFDKDTFNPQNGFKITLNCVG